jgi:short-subunit dehydrogenase
MQASNSKDAVEIKMSEHHKGTALITGASTGIGAVYADRLAKRGYDLILVARDQQRLDALADRLRKDVGVKVEVLRADLTVRADVQAVEQRLKDDASVTLLVNNAGIGGQGGFAAADLDKQQQLIDLNITAVTRLAGAAIPGLLKRGGAIINLGSVLAYVPEMMPGIYSATKAYVVNFSKSLQTELGDKGLYVQAVLPAATATEIWERSGGSIDNLAKGTVMAVDDLVDAALVGFDRRELATFPSLPDEGQWTAFEGARFAMAQNFGNDKPAERYRETGAA